MSRVMVFIAVLAAFLACAQVVRAQAEQQSGSELRFENVDEVRGRPSDIHIGSDPEYRPGMEGQYGGSDQGGYEKQQVETDKIYIEEKTYYKRVDGDEEKEPSSPPSRWE